MHTLNPHLKRASWIAFIAGLSVFVLIIGYYGIGDIAAAQHVCASAQRESTAAHQRDRQHPEQE